MQRFLHSSSIPQLTLSAKSTPCEQRAESEEIPSQFDWTGFTHQLAIVAFLVCVGVSNAQGVAQEERPGDTTSEASKQFELFTRSAQKLDCKLTTGEPLTLSGKSILNWTIGDSWHGSFFVWKAKQQPVMVGCYLADSRYEGSRRFLVELHSISDAPIASSTFPSDKGVEYTWTPDTRGASLAIADAPVPDRTAIRRTVQMRELAQSFSVTMYEESKFQSNGSEQLRMQAKPLYRFPAEANAELDGAIYSFVTTKGTDPEFLLLLECNLNTPQGKWLIRPMRFCTRKLELNRNNAVVWSVPEYNLDYPSPTLTNPYMIVTLLDIKKPAYDAWRESQLK